MSLIETKGLTKSFNGIIAVDHFELKMEEGVCTALLGPNGAGKSTMLNMLTGLMKPTKGKIIFHKDYHGDRRKYIGYLPQFPKFYGWMTGEEYLVFSGQLGGLSKVAAKKRTEELLELVGLAEDRKKKINGYSGGMKQRLGIAQALVHDPKLIILDEPVSALDPIGRREVLSLLKDLKERTSILFSTHVLHDAEQICENIYIMNKGKNIIEGNLVELQKRYQKPTIFIETEESISDWANSLKSVSWVRNLKQEDRQLTLTVEDIDLGRQQLLSDKSLQKLKINKFEVVKTSLEDLFMEVTHS